MIHIRTVCISPHLNTLFRALHARFHGFLFVYADARVSSMREKVGWKCEADYPVAQDSPELRQQAETVDVVMTSFREGDLDLMERRCAAGRKTIFFQERWLKPIPVVDLKLFGCVILMRLPGIVRLLVPSYFKMARRFAKLMDSPSFYLLPIGVHAVCDMVRIYRFFHGDVFCFFHAPKVEVAHTLGATVAGFPRMHLWAYFVEPSSSGGGERCGCANDLESNNPNNRTILKILWVGRMLSLKRVDTLIKAFKVVVQKRRAALLLVGEGPERNWLEKLAGAYRDAGDALSWTPGRIRFHNYIKGDEVRALMRQADVYVMPSNGEEGWGAAVSDALTEGCPVISTHEAGGSATLLHDECLYHAGNVKELASLIENFEEVKDMRVNGDWKGSAGAQILSEMIK